jgi:hypothetical protein
VWSAISNSAVRPVVIVFLDPTSDRRSRFFRASILRGPDFLFLQTAVEPVDVAVAFRVMIGRPPMGDAEPAQRLQEALRSEGQFGSSKETSAIAILAHNIHPWVQAGSKTDPRQHITSTSHSRRSRSRQSETEGLLAFTIDSSPINRAQRVRHTIAAYIANYSVRSLTKRDHPRIKARVFTPISDRTRRNSLAARVLPELRG